MVVGNFDVVGVATVPAEAEAVLVVDPDGLLAGAFGLEGVEFVGRWEPEIVERHGRIALAKFAQCGAMDGGRKFGCRFAEPDSFGGVVGEALERGRPIAPVGIWLKCNEAPHPPSAPAGTQGCFSIARTASWVLMSQRWGRCWA